MIEFREIVLSDAQKCREFFENSKSISCDYTFGNLYCWKDAFNYRIAFSDGFLFVRAGNDEHKYFMPLGEGDIFRALELLRTEEKENISIYGVSMDDIALLKDSGVEIKQCSFYRDASDYIYKIQDLVSLSGKKYHSKRNFVSRFEKTYNWTYESLNTENISLCKNVFEKWLAENLDQPDIENEQKAIYNSLDNFDELKLSGGILKVCDKAVAFTIGEPINDKVFCVHTEKALTEYVGAYAMLNRQFLADSCMKFELVNREEDMGLEGLRKAKESYHPAFIFEKYNIVI